MYILSELSFATIELSFIMEKVSIFSRCMQNGHQSSYEAHGTEENSNNVDWNNANIILQLTFSRSVLSGTIRPGSGR